MTAKESNVCFRVDASHQIGIGHLKRCISLADALGALGCNVHFVMRELGFDIESMNLRHRLVKLPRPVEGAKWQQDKSDAPHASWAAVSWQQDADETAEILKIINPDWLVVDHYSFDERWHRQVHRIVDAKIGAIDDLADRDLAVAMVVDPNPHADHRQKYTGRLLDSAQVLGGPRYALLVANYLLDRTFEIRHQVQSIGIFLGGADASQLTQVCYAACRDIVGFAGDIEIATTSANPRRYELLELAETHPRTHVVFDLPDLVEFFQRHDIQIGAAGGASWERCKIGVPTVALTTASNQDVVGRELSEIGAATVLSGIMSSSAAEIAKAVASLIDSPELRAAQSRLGRQTVDGLGAKRVALFMLGDNLSVRNATPQDSEKLFGWRNHPVTRAASLNPVQLSRNEHEGWFSRVVCSPEHVLLIGHIGTTDIGVVRFDRKAENSVDVSIYLDPNLHGLRLGPKLLRAAEAYFLGTRSEAVQFSADILENNVTSCKTFAVCGYRFDGVRWRKNSSVVSRGDHM